MKYTLLIALFSFFACKKENPDSGPNLRKQTDEAEKNYYERRDTTSRIDTNF